jgi:hypothetical protein
MSQKDPIFAYFSSAACGSIKMNVFVKTSEKYIRGISPPGRAV